MTWGRPLVLPAAGYLAGIAAGLACAAPPWALLPALLLVCLPRLAPAAFLAAGWLVTCAARPPAVASLPAGETAVEGRILGVPETLAAEAIRFRVAQPGGVRIEVTSGPAPWPLSIGDRIRLQARLRPPAGAGNPGARDRAAELSAAGIDRLARATSPVVRLAPPSPAVRIEVARQRFASACTRFLPAREAGLVRAIGAGDRAGLDDATRRSFARSGLAHVLAVSGLHLVVVVYGLWRLLRGALLRWDWAAARVDPGRLSAAVCLPWVAVYAIGTGASAPVLRAALAAAIVLAGALLRREPDVLNGLALAALVLLSVEPASAIDPSFQLSFAAVAGLALWAGPIRERMASALGLKDEPGERSRLRRLVVEPLLSGAAATVAASLATAPILAFHFRQLPLLGVAANVAAVPVGTGLTVLATAAALAAALHPLLAAPFLRVAWPLAWGLRAISDLAAAPRWGALGVGSPGVLGAALAGGLALLVPRTRGLRRALVVLGAAACLLAPPPLRALAARARGGLEVIFLSVGQGDAALLRLPDGSVVLLDGGGTVAGGRDPGERDVVPLLRDLGVRRLAAVILSHPHPDHALGLAAVLDSFTVERAFGNGDTGDDQAAAVVARLRPTVWRPGDSWSRAGVRFEVLGGERRGLEGNDASLVVKVAYGTTSFLFPGDVEAAGEEAAVRAGRLGADVVKVPHHGSRTSSSMPFVAAVGAAHAVVSVGSANRFGFPRAETLARWESAGAAILRTDQGAVRFLSDGRRIERRAAQTILDPLATARERP